MRKEDVIDIVDDRISQRFESYAQAQIKIHEEYHSKIIQAVETQIKLTVNGKIDKIDKKMDAQDIILKSLDGRIKPFEATKTFFTNFKNGLVWLAGFITPIAIISGAIMWLKKSL